MAAISHKGACMVGNFKAAGSLMWPAGLGHCGAWAGRPGYFVYVDLQHSRDPHLPDALIRMLLTHLSHSSL